ncbi:hypothetical protein HaLaN_32545, partial [Haematococcus lacustris]
MLARFVEEVQCNSAVLKLCSAKQVVPDELLKHVAQHLHALPKYLAAVSDITDPCVEGVGPDQARSERARLAGNAAYKQGQLLEALLHYNDALKWCACMPQAQQQQQQAAGVQQAVAAQEAVSRLHANRSLVLLRLAQPGLALQEADCAVRADPTSYK